MKDMERQMGIGNGRKKMKSTAVHTLNKHEFEKKSPGSSESLSDLADTLKKK